MELENNRWIEQQPYCRWCDMSGVLFGVNKKTRYKLVFRCPCVVGQKTIRYQGLAVWSEFELGNEFEIEPFAQEGFDRKTAKPISEAKVKELVKDLTALLSRNKKETEPDKVESDMDW